MELSASGKRPRTQSGDRSEINAPLSRQNSRPRYESSDDEDASAGTIGAVRKQTVVQKSHRVAPEGTSLSLTAQTLGQATQPSGLTSRVSQANLSGYDDLDVHKGGRETDGTGTEAHGPATAGTGHAKAAIVQARKSRWAEDDGEDNDTPSLQPTTSAAAPVPGTTTTTHPAPTTAQSCRPSSHATGPRFYGSSALYAHFDAQRAARDEIRLRYSQSKPTTLLPTAQPPSSTSSAIAPSGSHSLAMAAELAAVDDALPPLLRGCRSIALFKPIHAIDEGAYGKVWLGEERATGRKVALKQFLFDKINPNEGFPVTALREINTLLSVSSSSSHAGSAHLVRMQEVVIGSTVDKVYMVMEYLPHNLRDYITSLPSGSFFTQGEVKCLLRQLLLGLACMHSRWLIHRDLKTANCLMDNEGGLCLCDFGLARRYGDPLRPYTDTVVTLWYRAPEVLLGSTAYGPALDLWSIGCIFAELLTKEPLFPLSTETAVLQDIFKMLGTPRDTAVAPLPSSSVAPSGLLPGQQTWPGWKSLPLVQQLRAGDRMYPPQPLRKALKLSTGPSAYATGANISESGLDLLQGLLTLDPSQRLSAEQALAHPWFTEQPLPTDPRLMPAFPSNHGSSAGKR